MKKGLSVLLIVAALFGFYGGAANLNDVLACKDYWEEEGERSTADMNKLEDGLNQLKENEQAYLDGLDTLEEGEKALADGEEQYAAGQAELAKGEADYAAAPGKLAAARAKLAKGEKDLAAGEDKLAAGKEKVAQGEKDLAKGKKDLAKGEKDLEAGKAKVAQGEKDLAKGKKDLAKGEKDLEAGKAKVAQGEKDLAKGKKDLAKGEKDLEAGKAKVAQGEKDLANGKKQYEEGKKAYEEAPAKLAAGEKQKSDLEALIEGLKSARSGYNTAWKPGFENKAKKEDYSDAGLKQARGVITSKVNEDENKANIGLIEQLTGTSGLIDGVSKDKTYAQFDKGVNNLADAFESAKETLQSVADFAEQNAADTPRTTKLKAGLRMETTVPVSSDATARLCDLTLAQTEQVLSGAEAQLEEGKKSLQAGQTLLKMLEQREDDKKSDIGPEIAAALNNKYPAEAPISSVKPEIEKAVNAGKDNVDTGQTQVDQLTELVNGRKEASQTVQGVLDKYGDKLALASKLDPRLEQLGTLMTALATQDLKNGDFADNFEKMQGGLQTLADTLNTMIEEKLDPNIKSFRAWDKGYQQLYEGQQSLADTDKALPYAFGKMVSNETINKALKENAPALIPILKKYSSNELKSDDMDEFNSDMKIAVAAIDKALPILYGIRKSAIEQLDEGYESYESAPAELAAAEEKLAAGEKDLATGKKAVAKGEKDLAAGRKKLAAGEKVLEAGKKAVAQGKKDLAAGKKKLAKGEKDLAAGKKAVAKGEKDLAAGRKKLAAGEKDLAAGKKAVAKGEKDLAAGRKKLADGKKQYAQGLADYKAAPAKLAEGRAKLADAEQQLNDGRKQLAEGKEKLAEYEDGEQQVRDGLATLMATEANGGLQSIFDRRSGDDDFDNGDKHLELDEGLEAVEVGRGYQADSGELITQEITKRAVGTGLGLGAGALAVLAGILSLLKKNKGAGTCAALSAIAGGAGIAAGTSAGMEFSSIAGSAVGATPWIAFGILAAVAAAHAIVHFTSKPEA